MKITKSNATLEVRAAAAGMSSAVFLHGEVGEEWGGVTSEEFRAALTEVGHENEVEVHIHSPGGYYLEGINMHTALKRHRGEVSVFVDGLAASAASVVAMAGDSITMARGSWLMAHNARTSMDYATAEELRSAAERLEGINGQMAAIYATRYQGTLEDLTAALAAELWLSDEQAVAVGLADAVEDTPAIAARVSAERFHYQHMPKALAERPRLKSAEAKLEELSKI